MLIYIIRAEMHLMCFLKRSDIKVSNSFTWHHGKFKRNKEKKKKNTNCGHFGEVFQNASRYIIHLYKQQCEGNQTHGTTILSRVGMPNQTQNNSKGCSPGGNVYKNIHSQTTFTQIIPEGPKVSKKPKYTKTPDCNGTWEQTSSSLETCPLV